MYSEVQVENKFEHVWGSLYRSVEGRTSARARECPCVVAEEQSLLGRGTKPNGKTCKGRGGCWSTLVSC